MGERSGIFRYLLVTLVATGAIISFWTLLTDYLGEFAVFLYRYEHIIIPGMIIFIGIMCASALHLEPVKFLLYPIKLLNHKINNALKQQRKKV
jgi:hypothetical protein